DRPRDRLGGGAGEARGGREAARARADGREALAPHARRADARRGGRARRGAGLRALGDPRAGQDAQGDRRQAERRDRQGPAASGRAQDPDRVARHGHPRHVAGGDEEVPRRADPALEQGGQGQQHHQPVKKLAILDDYQRVALRSADWGRLERRGVAGTVFHEPFASVEDAAAKLAPFEILCLMRERTAFPRALVERRPALRFVSLTGLRAGTLDARALGERGIPVSNTRAGSSSGLTAELAWGLIVMAARGLARAERNMREGRWHEDLPLGI